jgi:hypothetical protein
LESRIALDLKDQRWGNIVVEKVVDSKHWGLIWLCRCRCGRRFRAKSGRIAQGKVIASPECRKDPRRCKPPKVKPDGGWPTRLKKTLKVFCGSFVGEYPIDTDDLPFMDDQIGKQADEMAEGLPELVDRILFARAYRDIFRGGENWLMSKAEMVDMSGAADVTEEMYKFLAVYSVPGDGPTTRSNPRQERKRPGKARNE